MRRVLIVSPHFPPVNAPDMQRARQMLPHLRASGWDAEVLAVDPRATAAPQDRLLAAALPETVTVHRVQALSPRIGRWLGRGTLARRALNPLRRRGEQLLQSGRFDLVFFTTTQFSVFRLGPRWRKQFGIPYVLDWQDPWVTDFYECPGAPSPPGGWRYRWSQAEARRYESRCLAEAAGWVGTSEHYREELNGRYPWFRRIPQSVIPFGFEPDDFESAKRLGAPAGFRRAPGFQHFVYVGAAGPIMQPALETLFMALRDRSARVSQSEIRFHFIGTSYAPAGQETSYVQTLASRLGVADLVEEHPGRIPYFSALQTLREADAVLLLGSSDQGYQPSKFASLLYSGKPVLAIVSTEALANRLSNFPKICVVRAQSAFATKTILEFCAAPHAHLPSPVIDLEQFSAAARTRELADLFDRACSTREGRGD